MRLHYRPEAAQGYPLGSSCLAKALKGFDVDPFLRQILPGADDFFGGPNGLTLDYKLVRGQLPERAVRTAVIIIKPPRFDNGLRIAQRRG
jgi:hypothetical protein